MASLPSLDAHDPTPTPASDGADRRPAASNDRAKRLAEAHAWVIEHHAETFKKLAK